MSNGQITFEIEYMPVYFAYIVRFWADGKLLPHHPVTFKRFKTWEAAQAAGAAVAAAS